MTTRGFSAAAAMAVVAYAGGASAQTVPPPPAAAGATVSDAIAAGHPLLEVRARYEYVDQTKTAVLRADANAYTVRTRLGWETADWNGFKALVEFEDVRALFGEKYQVNVPGAVTPPLNGASKSIYPIVDDPMVTELNRAQITWTPNAAFTVTGGRQRILIDDQRFIGNVGWRQDEQTFDGVRADVSFGRIKATYAYILRVNRILGELRDWESDSHLLNVTWSPLEQLRVEGFVYALDFANSAVNSSITRGARASGKTRVGPFHLAYDGTYARQSDYRNTPTRYGLDYWAASLASTYDIYTARAGYERLEGNGARGFTTPLGTTHGFQGWADAFVQSLGGNKSFVDGIEDMNFTIDVKPRVKFGHVFNTDLIVRYHHFDDERTGADLGNEWDAQVQASLTPKLTAAVKYADFARVAAVPAGTATPPASRTKVWFTLEYKL